MVYLASSQDYYADVVYYYQHNSTSAFVHSTMMMLPETNSINNISDFKMVYRSNFIANNIIKYSVEITEVILAMIVSFLKFMYVFFLTSFSRISNGFRKSLTASSLAKFGLSSARISHMSKPAQRFIRNSIKGRFNIGSGSLLSLRSWFSTSTQAASTSSAATEVSSSAPIEYFRRDYKPSNYSVPEINLDFQLSDSETIVTSTSSVVQQSSLEGCDLTLDGEELGLLSLKINDILLGNDDYYVHRDGKLTIFGKSIVTASNHKETFKLEVKVKINPEKNLALSGLYKSGSSKLLCTQCEAMGFRRIVYHLDRPDILSVYTVRLEADGDKYPLLLSNGNQVEKGKIEGTSRHWTVWNDPFPKPSYLFALVAGDLGSIHSTYTTTSGRVVQLGIYSDKENANQLDHAMYSLKESMKWDEDTFGLECDLDVYNVVATNDFNMGAM